MPVRPYITVVPTYNALQYIGDNFAELEAFAPVSQEDGKVWLDISGWKVEIKNTDWVLEDKHAGVFTMLTDVAFQAGYRSGGGP